MSDIKSSTVPLTTSSTTSSNVSFTPTSSHHLRVNSTRITLETPTQSHAPRLLTGAHARHGNSVSGGGGGGGGADPPTRSPSSSPRPQASGHSPTSSPRPSAISPSQPPRSSLIAAHNIMDWRPYDPSGAKMNVETILSPELEERRREVQARREEAVRLERTKYANAQRHHSDSPQYGSITGKRSGQVHPTNGSDAATDRLVSPSPPISPNIRSLPSPSQSIPPVRKNIPNAYTSAQYRSEIFTSDFAKDAFNDSRVEGGSSTSSTLPRKRNTMEAGRVYLAGEKKKKKKLHRSASKAESNDASSERPSSVIREIRVRTQGFMCQAEDAPPPIGAFTLYQIIEHNRIYLWLSILLTFLSLFAKDFSIAFLPKALDDSVSGLLLGAMGLFALEILANAYCKSNYFLISFMFWLDLVGTFSLCFDISWINDEFFPVTDGGGPSQIARSASILRLTKFARLLRILKLVRIVRVFKLHKSIAKTGLNTAAPTKVGLTLAELQDKKVIGMLMLVLVLSPFFIVPPPEDISPSIGLELLGPIVKSGVQPLIDEAIGVFQMRQLERNMFQFQLTIGGVLRTFVADSEDRVASLRSIEYDTYTLSDPYGIVRFSRREDVELDAIYSFSFTLCVMFIFIIGSFLMSRSIQLLIVDPLDRMTLMVKKLAGTILFLNHPRHDDTGAIGHGTGIGGGILKGHDGMTHSPGEIAGFETDAIEEVIAQMASIFSVEKDVTPGMPKSLAILSGSKHTQIRTLNSVVQIDVSERPRQLGEDGDLDGTEVGTHVTADALDEEDYNSAAHTRLSIADFPECATIEAILHHSTVLPYFKLFMTSNLTLENLLFVQEVDRFRTIMKLHVLNLYNAFISPKAPNQVNLPSLQRDHILAELDNPHVNLFDESQNECMNLMSGLLKQFHASKYCKGYMRHHASRGLAKNNVILSHSNGPKPFATHATMTGSTTSPIISHNPPTTIARMRQAQGGSYTPVTRTPQVGSLTPQLSSPTPAPLTLGDGLISLQAGETSRNLSPSHTQSKRQFVSSTPNPTRASNGTNIARIPEVEGQPASISPTAAHSPVYSQPVYLPGSIPTDSSSPPIILDSFVPGPVGRVSSNPKRSSGRAAPAVEVEAGVTIAETDLNAQIAALIEAEGPIKLREARRLNGQQMTPSPKAANETTPSAATTIVTPIADGMTAIETPKDSNVTYSTASNTNNTATSPNTIGGPKTSHFTFPIENK